MARVALSVIVAVSLVFGTTAVAVWPRAGTRYDGVSLTFRSGARVGVATRPGGVTVWAGDRPTYGSELVDNPAADRASVQAVSFPRADRTPWKPPPHAAGGFGWKVDEAAALLYHTAAAVVAGVVAVRRRRR